MICTVTKSSTTATVEYKWFKAQQDGKYEPITDETNMEYSFTPSAVKSSGKYACSAVVSEENVSSNEESSADATVTVYGMFGYSEICWAYNYYNNIINVNFF